MSDKYVLFGDAKEQIEIYATLINGFTVVDKSVKTENKEQETSVICCSKDTKLICLERKHIPFVPLIDTARYWAYVVRDGKETELYGTVAKWLYDQYANGKEPVTDLISIKTQEKIK